MLNVIISGTLGVFAGVALFAWLIGREKPPVFQAFGNYSEIDFTDNWRILEERVGMQLPPAFAYQMYQLELSSNHLFFTVPQAETDQRVEQNRFGFAKWLVTSGKITEFPVDGIV